MSETWLIAIGIGAINVIGLVLATNRFKFNKDKTIDDRLGAVETQAKVNETNIKNLKSTLYTIETNVNKLVDKLI